MSGRANNACLCIGADVASVRKSVGADAVSHASLFSESPVVVSPCDALRMRQVVDAIENVVKLPRYREAALNAAPAIAQISQRARGVFLGFDFHLGDSGPKLIEINTNAGGALLSAAVRRVQLECCDEVADYLRAAPGADALEKDIIAMFREEWRLARGEAAMGMIAIVDDDPQRQFLYPEFLLFRRLFEVNGIRARILDARELRVHEGRLVAPDGEGVDLVYNRCTDFYFEEPGHAALRIAFEKSLAVITPHPAAHAIFANKRNLALLTDREFLEKAGATSVDVGVLLDVVPATRVVSGEGERWWNERKRWFFKPASGFGSRGTYRGDKLTRRVFSELLRGDYVAQEFAAPGERRARVGNQLETFKVDVRNYAYAGAIQQRIARLYQGQTTNMRTPGGGFAPVYVVS